MFIIVYYTFGTYTYASWTVLESEPGNSSGETTKTVSDSASAYEKEKTIQHFEVTTETISENGDENVNHLKKIAHIKHIAGRNNYTLEDIQTVGYDKENRGADKAGDKNANKHISYTKSSRTVTDDKHEIVTTMADIEGVDIMYERLLGCKKLPDILTIGFEKCGTVTLNHFLGIHPQVFKTREENYKQFNEESTISVQEYTKNKECTPRGQFRLNKLANNGTAGKAFEVIPNTKLLAIVKEPVERTMSHFLMNVMRSKENNQSNFDDTVAAIMNNNNQYSVETSELFSWSRFVERLKPWIAIYGLDKIHVIDGDNFVKNPVEELQNIETFLGLQPFITEKHFVYSTDKRFYCLKENDDVNCMPDRKGVPHPQMSEVTRKRLQQYYKPFNEELFITIGRNFSWNY